tara:strand:- start:134005 stop:135963 length:1959 start_codon:yes stop_codon:yes gene_type:complete
VTFHQQVLLVCPAEHQARLPDIRAFAAEHNILLNEFDKEHFLSQPGHCLDHAEHVVVIVEDDDISEYVNLAKTLNFSLGIIPANSKSRLHRWFGIPAKRDQALTLAFTGSATALDVVRCNNEVVLGMLMLGETPFLDQRSKRYQNRQVSRWQHLLYWLALVWNSLRNLLIIKPFAITLTTGKDVTLKTAITGLVAIENDVNSAAAKLINTSISAQDCKISTILVAPKSVTEYLAFLLAAVFRGEAGVQRLPAAVSYIKSQYLKLESAQPLTYYVDGRRRQASVIELELYPEAVRINTGEIIQASKPGNRQNKDTMRVDNLPTNETRLEMIQSHLPLFTRALEDDFKDLFLLLRDNAQANPHYIALMMLSVVVASFGLFLSSAAVIIGAMVLAPLMAPIISLAMALLRGDRPLLDRSLLTIGIGVLLALGTAALIALIIPIDRITPEMAGRLHPNLLDLGVAIASGIAGGYAHARESIMKSLPGVAIAVALVPPLSVAGIGIGWWQWEVFSGAMLLFITNLVGIALSAALTFLVLGYAPLLRAKRGLAISAVLLLAVSIPLTLAFIDMNSHWQIERDLSRHGLLINDKPVNLSNLQVSRRDGGLLVRGELVAEELLQREDLEQLRSQLEEKWDRPVTLELGTRLSVGGALHRP